MGLFSKNKVSNSEERIIDYKPYIFGKNEAVATLISNSAKTNFKGKTKNANIKFPVELGIEHPFNFEISEGLYRKYGLVTAAVDKYVDFIVGPGFFVTSSEDNGDKAVEIIEQFMEDVDFEVKLRAWIREALMKGNGFLEMGGKEDEIPQGLKLLNANWMYVNRDDEGVVQNYNQFVGGFEKFKLNDVIDFETFQVAHLPLNVVGDDAYGTGIVAPAICFIDNLIQNQKDMHMIQSRKANSPLQVKMGGVVGGKYFKPNQTDIDRFGKDLEWLNNKHEWATDGLTEMKVIDFGNIGEKFNEVLNHDLEMIMFSFQIPEVLFGRAVNLATAPVQMDGFERRIRSMQQEIEKVVEGKIFKRVLQANGFDIHVEFNWGKLSTLEKDNRMTKLTELINNSNTSGSIRKLAEKEIVILMEFDEEEFAALREEEERIEDENRKLEEDRRQPIVPGQNARPPTPNKQNVVHIHTEDCVHFVEEKNKDFSIKEWLGFNYGEYKDTIDKFLNEYDFSFLKATNSVDIAAGLFNEIEIERLRRIMKTGFKKGQSMNTMKRKIDKEINLKDLFKVEDGKIATRDNGQLFLLKGKEHRAIDIIRTEVTKVANEGAKIQFKEGGVTNIRWVSSFGARTCPQCEALNGEIFSIDDHPNIPLHRMCRCTLIPVTKLD